MTRHTSTDRPNSRDASHLKMNFFLDMTCYYSYAYNLPLPNLRSIRPQKWWTSQQFGTFFHMGSCTQLIKYILVV